MPRTVTRPGPPSILLGVWGQGDIENENATALIEDYIKGRGDVTVKVLLPLDKDLTSDGVGVVFDVMSAHPEWEIQVIQTAVPRTKVLKEIKEGAAKTIESAPDTIEEDFLKALSGARDARLLFLWAEDAEGEPLEDDQRLLASVIDAGIECLDLTSGLESLGLDAEPVEEGEEPESEPETPEETVEETPEEPAADAPSEEEIRGWAERRLRKYAVECGMDKAESDALKKPALLAWIFEEDESPADGPQEPAEAPADDAPARPAREVRKALEEAKEAKEAAAEEVEDDEAQTEASFVLTVSAVSAAEAFGNLVADVIIERLAQRISQEPEGSAMRAEVSPPRPPGRTRSDGSAPTRRRTAK